MQTLTKPASGWITLEMDGSPVKLDFNSGEASLQKDGENLVFNFDDGSSSILQDFYKHGKDAKFIIDGQEISAQELFEAMNASNIMPAAGGEGQGAQAAPQNHHGASYNESAILGGTWSLRELDINFNSASQETNAYQTFADYVAGNGSSSFDSAAEPQTVPEQASASESEPEPQPVHELEPYAADVHLDIPAVFEGHPIAGRIVINNPPKEDCTVQIRIGGAIASVQVPAGAAEAEFTVDNPNTEDPFIDASSVEAEIVSIDDGGYDSTSVDNPSTISILDTLDKVNFVVSGQNVDETAETVAFTITSDDPVQTGSLSVQAEIDGTEYSVPMEWTADGWVGHVDVPVRDNDLLVNGKDTIEAHIVSAKHDSYEWENPNYGEKTAAIVVDNVDDAVFNTSIAVVDGQYVVEVTSRQNYSDEGHPTLTLTVNGEDRQIDLHWDNARELWTESVSFDLPAPTHSDETIHVEASISNPSMNGLEYENPICNPAVKDIVVEHEWWPVNASLDIPSAFEGSEITGRVILDKAPIDNCTVTVKIGDALVEVPISAGKMEADFTVDNPNAEDPFIDASSFEASIVSINGGRYDAVNIQDAVTVNILDTIDEVKFAIVGQNVDETAETAVFTVTSDDPVQTGTLSVTVDVDGTEYAVPMHWTESGWSGTLEVPVRDNDLLINGKDMMTAQVVSAKHDSYEWENPNYGKATEATVIDNVDDAVFNTAVSVVDGQYIVEVTSVQPNSSEGHPSLTLTINGESQQIDLHWDDAREMWVESVAFDLPAPTHSDETVHVEASISNPSMLGLEYENPICNSVVKDIVVEHEYWPVNASLDIPSAFEGSDIVGKIVLDNPPIEDCTATIKVGDTEIEVPVPAESTEVEFTVENPNGEDPFIDASSIEAEIVSINGGGYDEINLDSPVNVDILDTIDEVKFSITGEHLDETAETATFTITSDDPVQTGTLTVVASIDGNEYPVQMEWIDNGWTGSINVPVRENDLLVNGKDTIEAYVVSASHDGKVWENPNYGGKTEATVIDNVDDAVFNTSISVADGQYIVEVTSSQPNSNEGHPTLTLSVNGEDRQINLHWDDAREMWTESVSFDLPTPTHSDETVHVEASISNPSMKGLEYENPVCNSVVKDIVVEHEHWAVNAHLEIPSVFEGSEIAGRIILDNAPFKECTAVVAVGNETIEVPIPANATEVEFTVDNPNGEDPFIDASTIEAHIESINGGGYDEVNLDDPVNVSILDTIDEVKFAISGEALDETATTAAFTITSDDPVQTGSLTVVASIGGKEYSVEMEMIDGSWIGYVDVPVRENDLLINGKDTIDTYIVSAKHDSYEWENPNYGEKTEATVIDNVDDAVFNTAITVEDGQYIVEVTSAQPNSDEGHPTLTLTVNGESRQIDMHWDDAREVWTESVAFDLPVPTHSDETVHVEASISDPSMFGLEYENPICNPAVKDIVVEHEPWHLNAHLEVPSVFEGNEIAGKIVLDKAPFDDGCIANVKVGDATVEVPIPANAVEVEFTVENPNTEDPFIDASEIQAEIVSINGGGYDSVALEDPINVDILDTIDEVKFAITGESVDETSETATFTVTSDDPVQTGVLTVVASINGKEYSVEMELADGSWIGHVEVPVRENDLLINGKDTIEAYVVSANHDSYEWENPNYGKATEATIIDNVDDAVFNTSINAVDGQYVVEVTSAQPNSDEGRPSLTLTVNGENRQIDLHWDSARELWVESVSFDLPAPTHSDETVHVEASISNPSMLGLQYENPICNPAVKDIIVEHEPWLVNAHLEIPSVFEGGEIVGKVVLDKAPFDDGCIAVVKVGDATIEVPIPANALEATFLAPNPNGEDPFIDASSVQANIESINGGGYDSVSLEDPITVSILDTIDEVKFAITGEAVDETAATAAFTITSDDPVQTGSLTVVASIDGIEHSVEMHLVDGAWIGQVEVPVRENDLLINGKDTIEAHIVSARHDSYEWENPNYGKTTEATVIDNVDDAMFSTAITVADGQYVVEVTSAQPNSDEGHPTLTLTVNGESQQIDLHWDEARELWVESISFDLPAPTHSDETVHVEASISDPSMIGLEYENPILNSAAKDIVVEHEYWAVNAHLEIPSVFEGNEISGKVIFDNAPFNDDCIALVKVGNATVEVPISVNATEASFTVDNPNGEDPFIDASSVQAEIVSINGGGYDSVSLEDPINVNILDTIDEVKFAIAGQNVDEMAETTVFTITSDDPVQTGSLTVVASIDGKEYSIEMELVNGAWTGQIEVPVRENDLLINGKDTIDAYIVSAKHDSYEWENPNYGKATEATVIDNVDDAVFNTAITASNGQYVVEVTSVQPNSSNGHPTLTLTVNGESQRIDLHWDKARELWIESVSFDLPAPTHSDETVHVEASISDPSMLGLEYENPILNPAVKDIVVEHEYWSVNAHLEVPSVFEGNEIAGKVVLDNVPVDDCIATVKIGNATVEVPVEAGKTEASFTADNPNTEDPFIDASSVQAEIVSIDGGRYDEINLEDPIEVSILDTIDTVTFSITGENVDETAETTVFTVTSDDPVQTGTLTVTASIDGTEYAVPMQWTESGWTGQVEVPVRENDLLINGKDTIEAYVVSAKHDSYEWENPNYGDASESTVIDNVDDAVFNTSIAVVDGQYMVEVTSVQPNSDEGHPSLTLTVNGEDRQIDLHWDEARELWTESVSYPMPPSTGVARHLEASISNPSMMGLEYENPICNSAEITVAPEPFVSDPAPMTVDESYVPSGSRYGKGDGYEDSIFLGVPEGSSNAEYSLSFASAATEITALVDGLERDVFLQMRDDGSVVGRVQVNAVKAVDVFTVSVDDTGNVSFALTGNASIMHSIADNEGEEVVFDGIHAVMTSENAILERPLELHFLDDSPSIIEDSEVSFAREVPSPSQENNLLDCGPHMDFTMGAANSKFKNGMTGIQHWAAEGIELSAAIVKFDETGRNAIEVAPPVDTLEGRTHSLVYSGHNSNAAKPWNWGLNVKSSSKWEHAKEISYDIQCQESQAVVFDLGGKVAYGITVEFGACYDPSSTVMANDRQFPEAALIIFIRDGEIIKQEIASGLSSGMDSRTFNAALSGGFDCVVVSSLDNHSFDPRPRNQYTHVSDNEFTIRTVDFETHPRTEPIHSVEGDLLLETGADGISIAQKAVTFDLDAMGTVFDAVYSDGTTHTITVEGAAGNTCLNAYAEDGTLVFNAVVDGDGVWSANIYQTFVKAGASIDDDGMFWLSLAFKTGEDADSDKAGAVMLMPTQWSDEDASLVSVNVEIEAVDHTVAADATLVHADIDETMLGEDSSVEITVNGDIHVLEWNGTGFDPVEGFDFAWHQGSISWVEEMPKAGQMLEVNVVQKWLDSTGNVMTAYGEDNAQRELDVYGKEVHSNEPVPTLQDWLDSQSSIDDLINDVIGASGLPSSDHSDLPSDSIPAGSSMPNPMSSGQDYAMTASTPELDSIVMTMQTSAG